MHDNANVHGCSSFQIGSWMMIEIEEARILPFFLLMYCRLIILTTTYMERDERVGTRYASNST